MPQLRCILFTFLLTVFFQGLHLSFPTSVCGCQDRSPLSSVKANMHTFQTILETYGVDWGGVYPASVAILEKEAGASSNGYWKNFHNPYTNLSGENKSYADLSNLTDFRKIDPYTDILGIRVYHNHTLPEASGGQGMVVYSRTSIGNYLIYGLNDRGAFIRSQGVVLSLSNS